MIFPLILKRPFHLNFSHYVKHFEQNMGGNICWVVPAHKKYKKVFYLFIYDLIAAMKVYKVGFCENAEDHSAHLYYFSYLGFISF